MTTFDFTPMFRSTVGFDRMLRLLDQAAGGEDGGYPPYNIEKVGDSAYRIVMAVAGFELSDLKISTQENLLTVSGRKDDEAGVQYLHRGIATRAFERRFSLADFIRVAGAKLNNGLLQIELVREVPEALKPRTIAIEAGSSKPALEQHAA